VPKLRYMRLLILIPGSKAYTNWYHIFHIDIDTFVASKKYININISRVFGFEKCPYTNTKLVYDF
jgi:hypothetical protein